MNQTPLANKYAKYNATIQKRKTQLQQVIMLHQAQFTALC